MTPPPPISTDRVDHEALDDDQLKAIIAATEGVTRGNTGHGHVFKRPDGMLARCGGPGLCTQCSRDKAVRDRGLPNPQTIRSMAEELLRLRALRAAPPHAGGEAVAWRWRPVGVTFGDVWSVGFSASRAIWLDRATALRPPSIL